MLYKELLSADLWMSKEILTDFSSAEPEPE